MHAWLYINLHVLSPPCMVPSNSGLRYLKDSLTRGPGDEAITLPSFRPNGVRASVRRFCQRLLCRGRAVLSPGDPGSVAAAQVPAIDRRQSAADEQ